MPIDYLTLIKRLAQQETMYCYVTYDHIFQERANTGISFIVNIFTDIEIIHTTHKLNRFKNTQSL